MDPSSIYGQAILQSKSGLGGTGKHTDFTQDSFFFFFFFFFIVFFTENCMKFTFISINDKFSEKPKMCA